MFLVFAMNSEDAHKNTIKPDFHNNSKPRKQEIIKSKNGNSNNSQKTIKQTVKDHEMNTLKHICENCFGIGIWDNLGLFIEMLGRVYFAEDSYEPHWDDDDFVGYNALLCDGYIIPIVKFLRNTANITNNTLLFSVWEYHYYTMVYNLLCPIPYCDDQFSNRIPICDAFLTKDSITPQSVEAQIPFVICRTNHHNNQLNMAKLRTKFDKKYEAALRKLLKEKIIEILSKSVHENICYIPAFGSCLRKRFYDKNAGAENEILDINHESFFDPNTINKLTESSSSEEINQKLDAVDIFGLMKLVGDLLFLQTNNNYCEDPSIAIYRGDILVGIHKNFKFFKEVFSLRQKVFYTLSEQSQKNLVDWGVNPQSGMGILLELSFLSYDNGNPTVLIEQCMPFYQLALQEFVKLPILELFINTIKLEGGDIMSRFFKFPNQFFFSDKIRFSNVAIGGLTLIFQLKKRNIKIDEEDERNTLFDNAKTSIGDDIYKAILARCVSILFGHIKTISTDELLPQEYPKILGKFSTQQFFEFLMFANCWRHFHHEKFCEVIIRIVGVATKSIGEIIKETIDQCGVDVLARFLFKDESQGINIDAHLLLNIQLIFDFLADNIVDLFGVIHTSDLYAMVNKLREIIYKIIDCDKAVRFLNNPDKNRNKVMDFFIRNTINMARDTIKKNLEPNFTKMHSMLSKLSKKQQKEIQNIVALVIAAILKNHEDAFSNKAEVISKRSRELKYLTGTNSKGAIDTKYISLYLCLVLRDQANLEFGNIKLSNLGRIRLRSFAIANPKLVEELYLVQKIIPYNKKFKWYITTNEWRIPLEMSEISNKTQEARQVILQFIDLFLQRDNNSGLFDDFFNSRKIVWPKKDILKIRNSLSTADNAILLWQLLENVLSPPTPIPKKRKIKKQKNPNTSLAKLRRVKAKLNQPTKPLSTIKEAKKLNVTTLCALLDIDADKNNISATQVSAKLKTLGITYNEEVEDLLKKREKKSLFKKGAYPFSGSYLQKLLLKWQKDLGELIPHLCRVEHMHEIRKNLQLAAVVLGNRNQKNEECFQKLKKLLKSTPQECNKYIYNECDKIASVQARQYISTFKAISQGGKAIAQIDLRKDEGISEQQKVILGMAMVCVLTIAVLQFVSKDAAVTKANSNNNEITQYGIKLRLASPQKVHNMV
jgi:hypothetical protein